MLINRIKSCVMALAMVMMCMGAYAQKPNVVFVLTDDQGYGDIHAHGNKNIKTPHLDKLYENSVRFTDFHVATTCAPSRSGLLTGKYCNKVGVWHTILGRQILSPDETTLAQLFQAAGYKTGIFGKWHLGDNYPYRPQDRGFDEVLIHGGGGITQSPDYWNNDYFDDVYYHNGEPKKFEGYCNDVWFEEATKFIVSNKKKPFLCYIPTNSPHGPFNIEDKYSDQYKNNPEIPNPEFYGMISNIDMQVGKLVERLKKEGLYDNTIFIFMTDNGTAAGVKFAKNGDVVSGYNANMRGTKGSPYEGGHRVPFYLHWPKAGFNKGRDISELTSYTDLLPTLAELCKVSQSNVSNLDGKSLVPLLNGNTTHWPDRAMVSDVQREEFLVKYKQYSVMTKEWRFVNGKELYKIKEDPAQRHNVIKQYPDKVAELTKEYEKWWTNVSQRADEYSRVIVGTNHEKVTMLTSHDFHIEGNNYPAWNQMNVRAAAGENGFWALQASENGRYRIALRRYPRESKLALQAEAPQELPVPGGMQYKKGVGIAIERMKIKIGNQELEQKVTADQSECVFEVNLKKGDFDLYTFMIDKNAKEYGAYYVYIEKI